MKLTFSKTLLATMVFVGLTACSSGGGGGSSEPTTSSSSASNERVSTPLVQDSTSTASSSDSNSTSDDSITVPTVQNNSSTTGNAGSNSIFSIAPNQNNTASASPTASTFKLDSAGKPTGIAIYKGSFSVQDDNLGYYGSALGDTNELTLIADFDAQRVKGSAYFDLMETKSNNYSSYSEKIGSGELTLEDTKLRKERYEHYSYYGEVKGSVTLKDKHISDLKGYYGGKTYSNERYKYANTRVSLRSTSNPSVNLNGHSKGVQ